MNILDFFRRRCSLRRLLARLREENLQLKRQLKASNNGGGYATPRNPSSRTQEDFASALGSAVDSLQTRMSQMSNPMSDFAVREVSLQAKVSLEVTPLGMLTYRFVSPDDRVDAQKISTLSLTVVPVPKQTGAGTLLPGELDAQVSVEDIPGIDGERRELLQQHDIYTVGEFLQVGTRVRSAVQLAALLEVDRLRLSEWLAHAQLLMLDGVDGQTASILYDAGIRGLGDLASLPPAEIIRRYERQAGKAEHPTLVSIIPAQVESWIKIARGYIGTITSPIDTRSQG